MPRKLDDADVERLRELAAAGRDRDVLAAEFDVSRRHVDRIVRGDQRETIPNRDGAVAAAVQALVDGLELDAAGVVLAASASVLAAKLDALKANTSATGAMAAPGLVRALAETLRELRGDNAEEDVTSALRRMLGPVMA